jgi:hypothetical protein
MNNNQGLFMLGMVASGVLIYSAVTDNRIFDVLTGKAQSGGTHGDIAGAEPPGTPPDSPTGSLPDFGGGATGVRLSVVDAAEGALSFTSGYSQARPCPRTLADCATTATDCSGFATLCYKQAGAPDPNGLGYTGLGWTGTMMARGKKVGQAQPGDLHFWTNPAHVAIDIGNNEIIGWGSPPGPKKLTLAQEMSYHGGYYGVRRYLPPESALSAPMENLNKAKVRNLPSE